LAAGILVASVGHGRSSPSLSASDRALYTLGRYYWSLRTVSGLRRSIGYFKRVIADAPHSALGYAGLADANLGLYDYACDGANCAPYRAIALKYAFEAVATDAASSEAHTSLAMVLRVFYGDYRRSDREFRRAIALDSRNPLAYEWYGNSLLVRGRIGEARDALAHAATLDPVSPATFGWLARTEYYARDYASAARYAREALALDPERNETRSILVLAYRALGDGADARLGSRGLDAGDANGNVEHGLAEIRRGNLALALASLKHARFSSDTERAFLALDPRLDPVRNDPRFSRWTTLP
jgi:tetratricopeptide (TPR) repeat protein